VSSHCVAFDDELPTPCDAAAFKAYNVITTSCVIRRDRVRVSGEQSACI